MQLLNFSRKNRPSAPTKDFDVATAVFLQQVFHVFKKFNMSALVRGDGNSLDIFFDSCLNDLFYGPVVSQMDDLGAFALHDPPHNINSGVMTIEQTCSRDDPYLI